MRLRGSVLSLAVGLVFAPSAFQAQDFVRDVAHSQINFVAEAMLVDAHGTFDSWDALIKFDPANFAATTLLITIETKSINTRVTQRDNHLRSNDFFAADSFPVITFKSTIVNKLADDRVNITGELTIRGRTKLITIPSRLVFFDAERRMGRVKGETVINRHDFGVSFDPPLNRIRPEIQLQFDVSFKAKPSTP